MAATKPTLDHGRGSSFAFQISVTLFLVQPKSFWEPLNEIEFLRPSVFGESELKVYVRLGKVYVTLGKYVTLSVTYFPTVPTRPYLRQPILICSRPPTVHAC